MKLDEIGIRMGTDKSSKRHNFLETYERHVGRLCSSASAVLEIGVFNGASLRMWEEFFPNAQIVGVDIKPDKAEHQAGRICIEIGNAGSTQFLRTIGERHGPFDLILDDGSHLWDHQQSAFREFWPFLKPDGVFIIEDIHTSYVPRYGSIRGSLPTSVWFKYYVDHLLAEGTEPNAPKPAEDEIARIWAREISEVVLLRKSMLIRKSARAKPDKAGACDQGAQDDVDA